MIVPLRVSGGLSKGRGGILKILTDTAFGRWFFCLFFLIFIGTTKNSFSSSITIPLNTVEAPASDLLFRGEGIDADQAIDLSSNKIDLSLLDPRASDIWSDHQLPLVDLAYGKYPDGEPTVTYDAELPSSQGLFRSRVLLDLPGNESQSFHMILSLNSHTALVRNALMRKLGYPVKTPHYYKNITIKFKDNASRDSFLDTLSDRTLTSRDRWVRSSATDSPIITIKDVVLEPAQIDVPMYHWGAIPSTHLKGRRAIRALLIPLALMDIQESVNMFSFEFGKTLNNSAVLTYAYAENFSETTIDDVRWIARKIAHLSREELGKIIQAGMYPEDVSALILEKVIARRNQMIEMFNLTKEFDENLRKLKYEPKLTLGNIKKGKLSADAKYPDYALRFSYGDPDSPLRKSEIAKFLFMGGVTGGLTALMTEVNNYLQVKTTQDLYREHQIDQMTKVYDWYRNNPTQPYSQTLDTWGGPFGGFGIRANRSVITGNYYGSAAKIQVVDNLSISASIGYFLGFGGVPVVVPSVSGNLMVQRNYIHVRPVPDMTGAIKANWAHLFVPYFLRNLSGLLEEPKPGDASAPSVDERLQKFLETLKEGEMIMVTDSLMLSVKGQVNIPIPILLNPALAMFNPSVGFAAGTSPTMLRRTVFTRTADGVQVYIQSAKTLSNDIEFNFNWWMNIVKLSYSKRDSVADTRAYLLDKDLTTDDSKRKLLISLRALFRSNDIEVLAENFKDYKIHHDLHVGIRQTKALWWKGYRLEEDHRVRVEPPDYPDKARTLFSNRYVNTKGVSPYSFLGDIVTAASQNLITLPSNTGLNPAYSPLGSANWVNITTEGEVTKEYPLNSVSIIEQQWGGWYISQSGFLKILDLLENKLKPLNLEKSLIRRDEFATAKRLEMYSISSMVLLYESGLNQIAETLLNPSFTTVVNHLIAVEGKEELDRWCSKTGRKIIDTLFFYDSFTGKEDGKRVRFKCLKPWMRKALEVRKKVLNKSYAWTSEGRIQWQNRLVKVLYKYLDFHKLLNWVGKENYYLQVRVGGFRAGDENGDTEYVSDSIGSLQQEIGAGAFKEFSAKTGIMTYELYARYLAEGYSGY